MFENLKKPKNIAFLKDVLILSFTSFGGPQVHLSMFLKKMVKERAYLSEDEFLLIELRFFEERPFVEVGELLGITENNAKVKTYRVLDKLRGVYAKI